VPSAVRVDMPAVKARKDAIVAQSNGNIVKWLRETDALTVIAAHARFEGPHAVRAGDALLEAPQIFVNVGGRAAAPPIEGLGSVPWLDNVSIMEVDFIPRHLVIIGGSYVGLEFAQMYRRFGSDVTIVEMGPRLIGREDDEVSDAIRNLLEAEGISIRLDAKCVKVRRDGEDVVVGVDCAREPREVEGSHLLLATGRRPNTDDLGCDRAGIRLDERGYIIVDDALRTNVEGVFALGDVNGRGAFTHTSYNDYEIVAANVIDGEARRVAERIPTYALFVDPPLARVGISEREGRKSGRDMLVATMAMSRVGRARERGETTGFMKVLVDAGTKRILGAALFGIEADEAIHAITDVMYADAPYTLLKRAMHIHPTVAELIPTLLSKLAPLQAAPLS
jgi:pyruvate/2-oxoglutarate dehydrogenase complex dihydrolipoamide dehydrogenase (E3) component